MIKIPVVCAVLIICCVTGSQAVQAASVVIYGNTSITVRTEAVRIDEAIISGFESCSLADKGCRLLLTCNNTGYGAVWAAYYGGVIDTIGAACGKQNSADAQAIAERQCLENAVLGTCVNHRSWLDKAQ